MTALAANPFSAGERRMLRPPRMQTPSEWVTQHRRLTLLDSPTEGPIDLSITPYTIEILDAAGRDTTRQITFMSSAQVAKSTTMCNILAWAVDDDPAPTMVVLPTEDNRDYFMLTRLLRGTLYSSPQLRRYLSGRSRDERSYQIALEHCVIYGAAAGSPADLQSRPVKRLFMDEPEDYPQTVGQQGDPVANARERLRWFDDSFEWMSGTPSHRFGLLFREWELSDQRKYHLRCPRCGTWQVMEWDGLEWPDDVRDPDEIQGRGLAWYRCRECEAHWTDDDKLRLMPAGLWVPADGSVAQDGTVRCNQDVAHRGYHLSAFYSPKIRFAEIAAEKLRCAGNVPRRMSFQQKWLGEPWQETVSNTSAERIAELALPYERGTVPEAGLFLTAGVDVQKSGFYYALRVWGYDEESWLVQAGYCESWEVLKRIVLQSTYRKTESGEPMRVMSACIDSGDGHRTSEVYRFCRAHGEVCHATKGASTYTGFTVQRRRLDKSATGLAIAHGLELCTINTKWAKDKLFRLIAAEDAGSTAWHVHAEPDPDYCRQVTAEHLVRIRGRGFNVDRFAWQPKATGGANHYLDCEVGNIAAAEMAGIWKLTEPKHRPTAAPARRTEDERLRAGGNRWLSGMRNRHGRGGRGGGR